MTKLNGAMLAKVGWKIMTEQDALWVKVVKGKSLSNSNFLECRANAQSSYTWRSVIKGQDVLKRGLKWVIGNGRTVRFWIDVWIGNALLSTAAMGPISTEEMGKFVMDYVYEYGHWNWDAIGELLPTNLKLQIHAVRVFPSLDLEDKLVWRESSTGGFTTSSAYKLLEGDDLNEVGYA